MVYWARCSLGVRDDWRERASLIAALLNHGENVKKLADLIPDEYLLEQGISTDPGYPPKAVHPEDLKKAVSDRVATSQQDS